MTDRLTDEELKEMRERHEAATDGPCYAVFTDDEPHMNASYVSTVDRGPGHDNRVGMDGSRAHETVAITGLQTPRLAEVNDNYREIDANTKFMAAAFSDVPRLLDEVERLREERDRYLAPKENDHLDALKEEQDRLSDDVDQLIEALEPDQ